MIGIGKNERFWFDLPGGRAIGFRYMSARESIEYVRRVDAMNERLEKYTEAMDAAFTIVQDYAIDWRGFNESFSCEKLPDMLTAREVFDVASNLGNQQILSEREQKKSESGSPSNTANSAEIASPESALKSA